MGDLSIHFWQALGWVLVTQFLGFGLAGLARRFLIKPKSMVWPSILSYVALYTSFHEQENNSLRYQTSRYTFFWVSALGCFLYSWIPQYFFVVFQSLSLGCLIFRNRSIRFLASSDSGGGVGLGALTFDWYYVTGNTITRPWWATVNMAAGNVFWVWIVTPLLFCTKY